MTDHIFDAYPVQIGRVPSVEPRLWKAYCSCGWVAEWRACSPRHAKLDHDWHLLKISTVRP